MNFKVSMPHKQFVHTVDYDYLWAELNIFYDDVPLKLKNYKGIRLELAESSENCHIKVYGDGEQKEDYLPLTGTSTTIMFNPYIFSSEINRVTLQNKLDGKSQAKVISAWLIRQDDAKEYSDLSPYHGCGIANMENVPEPPFLLIGDANGDGKVDIVDVTMTISHILGQNPAGFNKAAADVNGDGKVDIVDVTSIIDMILKE